MMKERGSNSLQYEEKNKQLQAQRDERETVADSLRKIEDTIAKIEAHRQEAEELPALQKKHEQLSAQQHRLEGNIEGYMKSRRQSAGGQCPLLNQPCLNIIQLGMVSLESYFDGLLAEEHAQLSDLNQQLVALDDRMSYVKKYADALSKLGQYIERCDSQEERLRGIALDITRLNGEVTDLEDDLESLKNPDQQLAIYIELDTQVAQQETIRQQCEAGYSTYLKNIDTAKLLPEREQAYRQAAQKAEQAERDLIAAEQAYREAEAAFDEQELTNIENEVNRLTAELARLAEAMRKLQLEINALEQQIQHDKAILVDLEPAENEKHAIEELHRMIEQFRKLIREAAPHVLKAMMTGISIEANRIFGEIMGDRSAQLSWQNDYEIILHRHGANRTFAQLSGGEQIHAAHALRLA